MHEPKKHVLYLQVKSAAEKILVTGKQPTIERVCELLGENTNPESVSTHLQQWLKDQESSMQQLGELTLVGDKKDTNQCNYGAMEKLMQERTEQLNNSLSLVRATLESTADGILMIDNKGRLVDWNQKFIEMARIPKEILEKGDEKAGLRHMLKQVKRPWELVKIMFKVRFKPDMEGEVGEVHMKDGRIVERYSQPHKVNGKIVGRVWSFRDVTEQRRAEEALRLRERAITSSTHGVIIAENNPELTIIFTNPAFQRITGYHEQDVKDREISLLFANDTDQPEILAIREAVKRKREEKVVLRCYRKDGLLFWNEMHLAPVPDAKGKISHYVLILNDITERKAMEEQLMHQATHDSLTDLPNRTLLQDRISQAILFAKRNNEMAQVLFIDLDRFKYVNDGLGHKMGDHLLCAVSNRIKRCLRSTDTVARIGGDEFIIVLSPLAQVEDGVRIAQKILAAIREPFRIEDRELNITTSIGISCYPKDGADPELLIRNADTAMYHAKESGRDGFQFYTDEMNKQVSHRLMLENCLRRALEKQEFLLNYQPIYHLETGKIRGVEVLLRWNSPTLGRVSPIEFIPVAEEMGLIVPIGEWVMRTACAQTMQWKELGIADLQLSVNVSGKQMQQASITSMISQAIQDTGITPSNLVVELTESILMDHADDMLIKLQQLRQMGVKLAIDDFGTGYSSLSYLRRMPVDKLKIDRAFISEIGSDQNDEAITLAIIAMSKNLNLTVVAEGMQTKRQLEFLRRYQCDEVQGFYFSKPLEAESCTRLLLENRGLLGDFDQF